MAQHSRANPWLIEQNRLWRELAGSTITRWVGLDSNTAGDDELIFLEQGSPFQQLGALRVERGDDEAALDFGSYQNDDVFGLSLEVSDGAPQYKPDWYRSSNLSHLPVGRVQQLEARVDDRAGKWGDLIEVRLLIGGDAVLIVAAEVSPTRDEPNYLWADESYFVFSDPDLADSVKWAYERKFSPLVISAEAGEVFGT